MQRRIEFLSPWALNSCRAFLCFVGKVLKQHEHATSQPVYADNCGNALYTEMLAKLVDEKFLMILAKPLGSFPAKSIISSREGSFILSDNDSHVISLYTALSHPFSIPTQCGSISIRSEGAFLMMRVNSKSLALRMYVSGAIKLCSIL